MSMNEFAIVIGKAVMAVFGVIAIVFIGSFLGAIPFKWCWNYIVPGLFGLREIGFLESFCLIWVTGSIFRTTVNKP